MPSNKKKTAGKSNAYSLKNVQQMWKRYAKWEQIRRLVFDPSLCWIACLGLFFAELIVNVIVIKRIPYTEIDWIAYMQEVEGFINGTLDYAHLKGSTGPLVYPAGFVYIYTGLYYLTNHGRNIQVAQYVFAGLYLATLLAVFRLYLKSKTIPPYALVFMCCTSYRIHSIFVLRLFNDPVAIFLLYLAINFYISNRWYLGSLFFSLAVSVKMNILLFAPALFILFLSAQGLRGTIINLTICASVQLILALPFLLENPVSYIGRSFDIGRVFFYEWTVNWRFLPEEVFLNSTFHILLLFLHSMTLVFFFIKHWWSYVKLAIKQKNHRLLFSVNSILLPLFTCNFIGIAFSRSLHYQFYVWYYHSLPFLLWSTTFPAVIKIIILGVIELAWNTYPSTAWSSISLHICHLVLIGGLWKNHKTPQSIILKKNK
ncbi:Lethal(2)neighbour of tid protein [Chamberlinius hualienensis]